MAAADARGPGRRRALGTMPRNPRAACVPRRVRLIQPTRLACSSTLRPSRRSARALAPRPPLPGVVDPLDRLPIQPAQRKSPAGHRREAVVHSRLQADRSVRKVVRSVRASQVQVAGGTDRASVGGDDQSPPMTSSRSRARRPRRPPASVHGPAVAAAFPGDRVRRAVELHEPAVPPTLPDGARATPTRPARATVGHRPDSALVGDVRSKLEPGPARRPRASPRRYGRSGVSVRQVLGRLDIDPPDSVTERLDPAPPPLSLVRQAVDRHARPQNLAEGIDRRHHSS